MPDTLPQSCQTLAELISRNADARPDDKAVTVCLPNGINATLTFREVDQYADDLAVYLTRHLGVVKGDRIAIQMPNCLAYVVAAFAVFKAQGVLVNLNPMLTLPETEYQLAGCGAQVLFGFDLFSDKLRRIAASQTIRHLIISRITDMFPPRRKAAVHSLLKVTGRAPRRPHGSYSLRRALKQGRRMRADRPVETQANAQTPQAASSDLAILQYTGGTTGTSKWAMLTHANVLANLDQILRISEYLEPGRETILTVLPLYHIFAFQLNLLVAWTNGSHNILIPNPRPIVNLRAAFERFDITWSTGVNTLLNALVNEPWFQTNPPRTMKIIYAGGAPVDDRVVRRLAEVAGTFVTPGYGLTEASPLVTYVPLMTTKGPDGLQFSDAEAGLNGVGLPLPGTHIRIVDDAGGIVPQGDHGEIEVFGPQVMLGYWKQPEETAAALHNGWLKTGDIGRLDERGYLTILDRKKNMILVSGFNVFPTQIEDHLKTHPDVLDAGVIGIPDSKTGEAVVAHIVARPGSDMSKQGVRAFCREGLAAYKIPSHVHFRTDLPKTAVGKLSHRDLREETLKKNDIDRTR